MIPVCEPKLGEKELEYVTDCIKTNWISSKGKYITEFEEKFSKYCDAKYGIATSNGTTALHLALASLGIKAGDEVIIPTFSLDYEEPIVVKEKGEIHIEKIGAFVDKFFEKDGSYFTSFVEVSDVKNDIKVLTVDENLKTVFLRVKQVIRHGAPEDLFLITLETGRKVKVTDRHNIFCLRGGEILPVKTTDIKQDDYAVISKVIPNNPAPVRKIYLPEELLKLPDRELKDVFLGNIPLHIFDWLYKIGASKKIKGLKSHKHHRRLPFIVAKMYPEVLSMLQTADAYISGKHGHMWKLFLNVSLEFCRLLGYYVSEGSITIYPSLGYRVQFSFGAREEDLIRDVENIITKLFGLSARFNKTPWETQLQYDDRMFCLLLKSLNAGSNAKDKRVPDLILNVDEESKAEFLRGYLLGDGNIRSCEDKYGKLSNLWRCNTVSEILARDLAYLFLQLGIVVSVYHDQKTPAHEIKKTGQSLSESHYIMLQISNVINIQRLGSLLGLDDKASTMRSVFRDVSPTQELVPINHAHLSHIVPFKEERVGRGRILEYAEKHGCDLTTNAKLLLNSDLCFVKIKKIERVKPSKAFVYDISVENERFIGGFGGILLHNTMIATANSVTYTGAKPVLVDSEPMTWNMDPTKIEEKITKRTKAIMTMHTYGHPTDMDPVIEIAKKHDLHLLEDAAEAHGAEYKGKRTGGLGDMGCFSFYANKIITTGEGGMVVTSNEEFAERARMLRDQAFEKEKRFWHQHLGFNYRLTNLQAAVGVAQFEHIDEYVETRRRNALYYNSLLEKVEGISLPPEAKWAKNVYWMYTILIEKNFGLNRDELMVRLKEKGVDSRRAFYPVHAQPLYAKQFAGQKFPVADQLSDKGVYLPSGNTLTKKQIDQVVETLISIQENAESK